jgi:hypothetical protein
VEPAVGEVLDLAHVLVDGPYVAALDHPGMQYRGSANQRAIDLRAMAQTGQVMTLDWDTPEIIITPGGDVLGAAPVIAQLAGLGTVGAARRCGETGGDATDLET